MTDHTFSILPVITNPQRRARLWQGRSEAESVGHEAKRSALARVPEARQFTGREDGVRIELQIISTTLIGVDQNFSSPTLYSVRLVDFESCNEPYRVR